VATRQDQILGRTPREILGPLVVFFHFLTEDQFESLFKTAKYKWYALVMSIVPCDIFESSELALSGDDYDIN
jgi:hypothetical protein